MYHTKINTYYALYKRCSHQIYYTKDAHTVRTTWKSDSVCLEFDSYTICNESKAIHYTETNFFIPYI